MIDGNQILFSLKKQLKGDSDDRQPHEFMDSHTE
jgi:hypothetical protein